MGGREIAMRNEKKRKEKEYNTAISSIENHFELEKKKTKRHVNLDVGYGRINPNDANQFAKKKSRFR